MQTDTAEPTDFEERLLVCHAAPVSKAAAPRCFFWLIPTLWLRCRPWTPIGSTPTCKWRVLLWDSI